MTTILCKRCNRDYTIEEGLDYDELRKRFVEYDNNLCPDCLEDSKDPE